MSAHDDLVAGLTRRCGTPIVNDDKSRDWTCPVCNNQPVTTLHLPATGSRASCSGCHSTINAPPAPGPLEDALSGGLVVHTADLSKSRRPRWAWTDRILVGYLNLLLGEEGVGKGTLIAWLIAQWTHGKLPGDFHGHPISVGILGDEDNFQDAWTPRLHAVGADLGRVHQLERPDGEYVQAGKDRALLKAAATKLGIGVLIYDQLLDNLDGDLNERRQREVRKALRPIRSLAMEIGVATIGVLHPNKKGESFRELVSDSVAFNAVARSNLLLAEDPDDDRRRVVVVGKGNFAMKPQSFEFRLDTHSFTANGDLFAVPRVGDVQYGDRTVADLISEPEVIDLTQIGQAASLIKLKLPRDGKWHLAKPVYEAAEDENIGERTVRRAVARLELEVGKTRTVPSRAQWRWPPKPTPDTDRSSVSSVRCVQSDRSTPDTPDTPDSQDIQEKLSGLSAGPADDSPDTNPSGVGSVGSVASTPDTPDRPDTPDTQEKLSGLDDAPELGCHPGGRVWRLVAGGPWVCFECYPHADGVEVEYGDDDR